MRSKTTGPNNSTPPASPEGSPSLWGYTRAAYDSGVVENRVKRERYAGRKPRHTITRDSRIDGGVYEGSYGGEAIVVDSDKSKFINAAYDDIMRAISPNGQPNKQLALKAVFIYVSNRIRYDKPAVDAIFEKGANGVDHTKMTLDWYIGRGVGVCRHQALFVGVLLEKLVNNGVLQGRVSVDRNRNKRADKADVYDGHSWVRYTNSRNQVFILDVAQKKAAALSDLMQARNRGERVWDYARPEDHNRNFGGSALLASGIQENQFSTHHGSSGLEYDENGLIIVPDWFKQNK